MTGTPTSFRLTEEENHLLTREGRKVREQLHYDLALLAEVFHETQAGPLDFLPPDEIVAVFSRLVRRGGAGVAGLLTTAEALAICDAFNSFFLDPSAAEIADTVLVAEIEDSIKLEALDERHGIEPEALLGKLRGLSPLQALAVILWAKRFWSDAGTKGPAPALPAYDQDAKARAAAIFRCADR